MPETRLSVNTARMDELCFYYGKQLRLPMLIDGIALMQAFADNESAYGVTNTPRYEPAYDFQRSTVCRGCGKSTTYGGRYLSEEQRRSLRAYGSLAACSFSPWQVMYPVMLELGLKESPVAAMLDPEVGAKAFVVLLNTRLRQQVDPSSTVEGAIRTLGDAYNSGTAKDANVPNAYCNDLWSRYQARLAAKNRA